MAKFDAKVWNFPGKIGLTLQGHSRASEATAFHIAELGWALDGGIPIDKVLQKKREKEIKRDKKR